MELLQHVANDNLIRRGFNDQHETESEKEPNEEKSDIQVEEEAEIEFVFSE